MEQSTSPPLSATDVAGVSSKRKRSVSLEALSHPTPPPAKAARPNPNQLQINYLARQSPKILPLITTEDPLPSLLQIINDYEAVLQRHESMAGNMGARPLGPILIQRFERLFDGPPRVLKAHGKDGVNIGWLDVVEFARGKPEQFNLEKMRDGVRVCQFYTKQCRVEISEEDYVLIASGMPQRLIPPQPIEEDEEKELGTLEILEKKLGAIVQLADQVSARARQLNHRLKNRRSAILSRRDVEAIGGPDEDVRSPRLENGEQRPSVSPTSGFTAVNSRPSVSNGPSTGGRYDLASPNGVSSRGASAATRAELLSKFHTNSEREALSFTNLDLARSSSASYSGTRDTANARTSVSAKGRTKGPGSEGLEYAYNAGSPGTVAIPNTPTSLLPYTKPPPADRYDDSGPYKGDMMLRMEQLNRGDRVQPPCDRCRRLHMDCLKNLTACMGCTKKHAKCSWKDVDPQELKDHPFVPRVVLEGAGNTSGGGGDKSGSEGETGSKNGKNSGSSNGSGKKDWGHASQRAGEVRDEELLGESSDEDDDDDDDDDGNENENAGHHHHSRNNTMAAAAAAVGVDGTIEDGASAAATPTHDKDDMANGTTGASSPLSAAPKDSSPPPPLPLSLPLPAGLHTTTTTTTNTNTTNIKLGNSALEAEAKAVIANNGGGGGGGGGELSAAQRAAERIARVLQEDQQNGMDLPRLSIEADGDAEAMAMAEEVRKRAGMRWDANSGRMMLD